MRTVQERSFGQLGLLKRQHDEQSLSRGGFPQGQIAGHASSYDQSFWLVSDREFFECSDKRPYNRRLKARGEVFYRLAWLPIPAPYRNDACLPNMPRDSCF